MTRDVRFTLVPRGDGRYELRELSDDPLVLVMNESEKDAFAAALERMLGALDALTPEPEHETVMVGDRVVTISVSGTGLRIKVER